MGYGHSMRICPECGKLKSCALTSDHQKCYRCHACRIKGLNERKKGDICPHCLQARTIWHSETVCKTCHLAHYRIKSQETLSKLPEVQ